MMRLIGHQYDYGRLYNRTIVANVVGRMCGRHAYAIPDDEEGFDHTMKDCLVDFTPDKWEKVLKQVEYLRSQLLRNDASIVVLPGECQDEDADDEDEEHVPDEDMGVNRRLEANAAFSRDYDKILGLMKFHQCLSHLQPRLEDAIQNGSAKGTESVVIPHDDIVAFK